MNALFQALLADSSIAQINEYFHKKNGKGYVYGLAGTQKHAIFAACFASQPRTSVIMVHNRAALEEWRADLQELLPETTIAELPEIDLFNIEAAAHSVDLSARRMNVLGRLLRQEKIIVLAPAAAAVQKGISHQEFSRLSLNLALGSVMEREQLLAKLVQLGYENVYQVERLGQFSTRGGIVDIFPINSPVPLRVEFFDDEIDSLREFDLASQRSLRNVSAVDIMPLMTTDSAGRPENFLSYLAGEGVVLFDEPMRFREAIQQQVKENPDIKEKVFSWEEILAAAHKNNVLYVTLMLQKLAGAETDELVSVVAKTIAPYHRQFEILYADLQSWLQDSAEVLMLLGDKQKAERMRESLAKKRVPSVCPSEVKSLNSKAVTAAVGTLLNGFELPERHLVVLTEKDIFGHQKKKRVIGAGKDQKITHFREINVGDYVVHVNHGIGKYLGVVTLDVGGVHRDYLHIKYGGDDKLFVPTDQVSLLQKYIGAEGETPRLHRMGGTEWVKAKTKAKKAVEDIAKELLQLYAKRQQAKGFAFQQDTVWQREFEDAFPYEETPDQLAAAAEIKADMEKAQPMDRLLCGDVGFGKTEVAIRAAFKAVMDGKQVAVLVPTTVLAQQHYQTFSTRFLNFGPVVDVVCRFRTAKEQKETLAKLAEGKVDILIGTHAILNQNKVKFKNLGLLIVDEEQRFGVKQKEKIKQVANGIDVLTLSATPIPRTLHMSLAGARDMSIIETPPAERYPVQTYVIENNDAVLQSAIKREIKRGGQVYFVYNRVETIDIMRQRLEKLVPEARIQTAHGQMPEEMLERVMMEFYEGKYDILLATSIVENGLDVANANTIIVYNADYFGLAQLYQMRGRVGRSSHMAFAYFVYQADKVLTEMAEKRLQAMKEFAELGAGFKIAMRDLEIRGAGNLLGSQQHGHIASVGFEMYCRLLEEAVQALKNGKETEIIPDPVIELPVEAYIDGSYISDPAHKIEIYQRIAAIHTEEEIANLQDELIDRFGDPSEAVMRLLQVARLRNYARSAGVKVVSLKPAGLEITFLEKPNFDLDRLLAMKEKMAGKMKFLMQQQMVRIKVPPMKQGSLLTYVQGFLCELLGKEVS